MTDRPLTTGEGSTAPRAHGRDYIERTIATVRIHRDADNCWPQWANIFADEIEAQWAERDALREQLDAARQALSGVSNGYGCFAGCTGALAGAPADDSGHTPACRAARAALGVEGRG